MIPISHFKFNFCHIVNFVQFFAFPKHNILIIFISIFDKTAIVPSYKPIVNIYIFLYFIQNSRLI